MITEQDTNRKFPRIHFGQQVNFDFDTSGYNQCRTINLSLGGMFITGDFLQQVGSKCNINLVPEEVQEDFSFQALAKVVRKTGEGVAMEFCSMPSETFMFLQTTLRNVQTSLLDESEMPREKKNYSVKDCNFIVAEDSLDSSGKSWDVILPSFPNYD